jgi:transposase
MAISPLSPKPSRLPLQPGAVDPNQRWVWHTRPRFVLPLWEHASAGAAQRYVRLAPTRRTARTWQLNTGAAAMRTRYGQVSVFPRPTAPRFVFLDEAGTATNMARRYGRSPRGARLVAAVPHGHWRTTTFVAGLRESGIIAPLVLDGPITGPAFRAYVEQFPAPVLVPGDVVVLDDLAANKVAGVRQAIAAAGASVLYLPPYSPDLNPLEQLFAKLKALLRKAAARTKDELWQAIGRLLATVSPSECANYLNHCGYGST